MVLIDQKNIVEFLGYMQSGAFETWCFVSAIVTDSMSLKQSLKGAKAAIERNDPQVALEHVDDALYYDKNSYLAYIFRGKSYQLLDQGDSAIEAFKKATALEPENVLGWKGYFQTASSQDKYDVFFSVLTTLIRLQIDQGLGIGDTIKDVYNYLNRRNYKLNEALHVEFLRSVLPGTELGDLAPGSFGDTDANFCKLIDILSRSEGDIISTMVQKEKLRLPRTLTQENRNYLDLVAWSVYKKSEVGALYDQFMHYCRDDDLRVRYEELRLKYKYGVLKVAPNKAALFAEIKQAVDDMVLVRTPSLFCWKLHFDWCDVLQLGELDRGNLSYFLQHFQSDGLAKVLYAYLMSDISPWNAQRDFPELFIAGSGRKGGHRKDAKVPQNGDNPTQIAPQDSGEEEPPTSDEEDQNGNGGLSKDEEPSQSSKLPPSEILSLMLRGFVNCADSILANRIICNYYIHIREYPEGSKRCREAIKLLADTQRTVGVELVHTREDILCSLATIYTYYEAPKNYSRALQLYDRILETSPHHIKSFIGKGLILLEKGDVSAALELLETAMKASPDSVDAASEYYWCLIKMGRTEEGRQGLENTLKRVIGHDVGSGDVRAVLHWRIAKSLVGETENQDKEESKSDEYSARLDSERIQAAHKHLLDSLKDTQNYPPTYTLLGWLYEERFGDHARAQKCFYKAFELDVAELTAARYLVADLTDKNQWSLAEMLCQRVVETERSRRMLVGGSHEEGDNSWPYRVLGCSALNGQDDARAVEWFQTALRMTSMDIECWIGLGEAYYNCGRFEAAAKVFRRALDMDGSRWVVHYMLGVVLCEMGEFSEGLEHLGKADSLTFDEACVLSAKYEAQIEYSRRLIDGGFFGRAIETVSSGLQSLSRAVKTSPNSPKLWKSMGDAFRVFLVVRERALLFPFEQVEAVLSSQKTLLSAEPEYEVYFERAKTLHEEESIVDAIGCFLVVSAYGGVVALPKSAPRALRSAAWYNLGVAMMECERESGKGGDSNKNENLKFPDSTPACPSIAPLKKAVRLEQNNPVFWLALGNAYASSHAALAQHCYIRSLSLDGRNADVWTNLGALYLLHGDSELAQTAFLRSQSMAPQQAKSWMGTALGAHELHDERTAASLFTHAYVVANGRVPLAQLLYGLSVVQRHIAVGGSDPSDVAAAQEVSVANFAMAQYLRYQPEDVLGLELALAVSERCQNYDAGVVVGERLCRIHEQNYERKEDVESLAKYAATTANVARLHLGKEDYQKALEMAESALELNAAAEEERQEIGSKPEQQSQELSLTLSCHVVIGLCHFFQQNFAQAVQELKSIVDSHKTSQRIATLTAQILYACNNSDSQQAALDELFSHIEKHGSSLLVVLTLGALAVAENCKEYYDAIREELSSLSLLETVTDTTRSVPRLLAALEERLGSSSLIVWRRTAVLFPHDFHVWRRLNCSMAIALADLRDTKVTAWDLANAYSSTHELRHMQRAVMLDPLRAGQFAAVRI